MPTNLTRTQNAKTIDAKALDPKIALEKPVHLLDPQVGFDPQRQGKVVKIALAGAGGTGSQMVTCLARMDRAMRSLEIGCIDLDLYDPDTISKSNVGRQLFYDGEIGQHKAIALINRANMGFCVQWQAFTEPFLDQTYHSKWTRGRMSQPYDFLITCIDSGQSKKAIFDAMVESQTPPTYWLDLGNEGNHGQVILGQVRALTSQAARLETVVERYPEFFDGTIPETNIPSCSLAEALVNQDLFINDHVARWGAHLLWTLLRTGKTDVSGYFISLKDGRVNPIRIGATK